MIRAIRRFSLLCEFSPGELRLSVTESPHTVRRLRPIPSLLYDLTSTTRARLRHISQRAFFTHTTTNVSGVDV